LFCPAHLLKLPKIQKCARLTWADEDQTGPPLTSYRSGVFLILAAAILWGTTGTAQAYAPPEALPPVIGALRLVIGGTALLIVAWVRGSLFSIRTLPLPRALLAAFFIAMYQLCFFEALIRTGVAVGTIIAIGSAPIFGGALGAIFRKEKLTKAWAAATALAIAGCVLIAANGATLNFEIAGILLALGAGFAYASFTLVSKGLLDAYPPEAVSGLVFCLAALILLPILFTNTFAWLFQPSAVLVMLHLGLVTTALAYLLFTTGLQHTHVSTATTLTLAEPLTAAALGIVLLGEKLSGLVLLGIGLIFAGLLLVAIARIKFPNQN
jgi:DME family drug/metabolite transporter